MGRGPDPVAKPAPPPPDPVAQERYAANPFNINSADPAEVARANQYNDAINAAGIANAGRPAMPSFVSSQDSSGHLLEPYQFNPTQISMPNINQDPLHALENEAMSTSPSPWMKAALTQQEQQQNNALGQAANQSAASTAAAEGDLAMRGGLSSGARERLAAGGASAANNAMQNVRNTGEQNVNAIGLQDAANKQNILTQLPGMEIANAAPTTAAQEYNASAVNAGNQYNISNELNNLLQQNASNLNTYNQQMKAWAAGKTADAQSGGGKK